MPLAELRWWYDQARRVLALQELRMANAASVPYLKQEDREQYLNRIQRLAGICGEIPRETGKTAEDYKQVREQLKSLPFVG